MKTQIMKLQRSLAGEAGALLYNQDRSFITEVDLSPKIARFLEGEFDYFKVFVYVTVHEDKSFTIQKKAPDQTW